MTTDGLPAYSLAIGNVLGHDGDRVDYAQLVKIYKLDVPEDARRYSPPRLAEAIPTPIYGVPRRESDLHVACREAELDDADVHAEAHSSDKRVLQEMGELEGRASASLRLV